MDGSRQTTMRPTKHYLYHPKILNKRLSLEQVSSLHRPSFSCLCDRVYGSAFLSYTKLHSLFRMPVVYADSGKTESDTTLNKSGESSVKDSGRGVSASLTPSLQVIHTPIREVILDSMTTEMEVQQVLANETGMERLREMFSKHDEKDGTTMTTELEIVVRVTFNTMFLTFIIMVIREGYEAKQRFIDQNRATVFAHKTFADRHRNDYALLEGAKVGLKWSFRVTCFTAMFMMISQCISVYRNKTTVGEYSLAGGLTGALVKTNLGPKGMFSGGVFGAVLGLLGGCVFYPLLKVINETQEQRHYRDIKDRLDSNRERPVSDNEPVTNTEVMGQPTAATV